MRIIMRVHNFEIITNVSIIIKSNAFEVKSPFNVKHFVLCSASRLSSVRTMLYICKNEVKMC